MAGANRRDLNQYADSLARYFPGGALFASRAVDGSTFRRLIVGLAGELFRSNGFIKEYCEELLPDETVKFIDEWESAVGIRDDCFTGTGTLDERRRDILVKLASSGIQTVQDFIDLADLFGITVTVTGSRFTITVNFIVTAAEEFPYIFPLPFGNEQIAILECLFNLLKPANCKVIFEQI